MMLARRQRGRIAAPWRRAADQLARYAWFLLLAGLAVGLIGGAIYAVGWLPASSEAPVAVDCPAPPCFGAGGLPPLSAVPAIVPLLAYLLAIILGVPSLLTGAWDLLHGQWLTGAQRLLPFVGSVLFLLGTEIIPHQLNPCLVALQFGGTRLPEFYCAYSPEWGADMVDRWHVLEHALLGAVPMAALFGWVLRSTEPASGTPR